jgi:hypothetical protein
MSDMYVDESLTETNNIVFECECGFVSWETHRECPRCGKISEPEKE